MVISLLYGIWYNYLDSASYCPSKHNPTTCVQVGEIMGGGAIYQFWNILGHIIPSLCVSLYFRSISMLLVGLLISSSVMDSPLWGEMRLLFYNEAGLWHCPDGICEFTNGCTAQYEETHNLFEWIVFYYNPIGSYPVWGEHWPIECSPTSALIFWSIVARVSIAIMLISWQTSVEKRGRIFSIKNILLTARKRQKL